MTLTAQSLVAMHDRTRESYEAERDAYAAKGFRTLSLSVYGLPEDPRYAAVMVLRPQVIETHSYAALRHDELMNTMNDMAEKQLYPYLVTATGPAPNQVYAVAFRHMDETPLVLVDMDPKQFEFQNGAAHDEGKILLWVDACGTADDTHYCAVWANDPQRTSWSVDAVDEGGAELQQRFNALTSIGARPALLAITPSGRLTEMFVDTEIGPWASRVGLTSAAYQAEFGAQAAAGRFPVCVSGSGSGDNARFAAIFATREEISPRVPRSTSLGPKNAAIDAAMQNFLAAHDMRGASLAIVQGTRLVYASGYTYAEADYPDLLPTTMYRQASISKAFCATAVMRLLNQGAFKPLGLDTPILPLLGLTPADGVTAHVDPDHPEWRYEDVTVRHLLGSISGIDQGGFFASWDAASDGQALPSNAAQVARWVVSNLKLTGKPGDVLNAVYGNMDYLLLSLIVARATGNVTFEDALGQLVLGLLGCDDTVGSRTLVADQPPGHARHHWQNLECGRNVRVSQGPIEPYQYGRDDYETFDGAGGLSSSVVDVARLCAMFASQTNTPLFTTTQLHDWFDLAAGATATHFEAELDENHNHKPCHGYYGFDGVRTVNKAQGTYTMDKGGSLPGTGTYFYGTTGGLFFIGGFNGTVRPGVKVDWLWTESPADPHQAPAWHGVAEAAAGVDWSGIDLFTTSLAGGGPATDHSDVVATVKTPGFPATSVEAMARVGSEMVDVSQRTRTAAPVRRPLPIRNLRQNLDESVRRPIVGWGPTRGR